MNIKGARALESRALVYIIDTCMVGATPSAGIAVMNRMFAEGIPTYLIAPLTPEKAADMHLACHEIFSIPELQPTLAGFFSPFKRVGAFIKMCRVLYDLSRDYSDVVVHTQGAVAGFWGRWAAWCVGINHVVHTLYTFPFAPYMKAYQWWAAYIAEYCTSWITSEYICVRASDRAYGARMLPFFYKRCAVIRPAVDWQQFYTPEQPQTAGRLPVNPIVLGMVLDAALPDQNETFYSFLRLIKRLYDIGVPIRGEIIGDGALRWQATKWLLEAGVPDVVRVLGFQAQTAAIIKTWHVFVHCALQEVMPVAVIQARLSWVPVVAYEVGGMEELIVHEKNGLLVAPADEQALFNAIYRVLIDRPLYERLSLHQESMNEFNEAVVALKHLKLYKSIASD